MRWRCRVFRPSPSTPAITSTTAFSSRNASAACAPCQVCRTAARQGRAGRRSAGRGQPGYSGPRSCANCHQPRRRLAEPAVGEIRVGREWRSGAANRGRPRRSARRGVDRADRRAPAARRHVAQRVGRQAALLVADAKKLVPASAAARGSMPSSARTSAGHRRPSPSAEDGMVPVGLGEVEAAAEGEGQMASRPPSQELPVSAAPRRERRRPPARRPCTTAMAARNGSACTCTAERRGQRREHQQRTGEASPTAAARRRPSQASRQGRREEASRARRR